MYISTSKCFPTIDCNPALQRVQFDQNLSPIRDNDPRVYRARVAWKGRRRYRLPLSWDIIGHGRAIRMPDWPHTTSISRGKLTRSWLNGKRYHTPLPKLARFGISRDKLANTGPSTIRSYRVVYYTSSAAHYAVLFWLNRVGNPLESTVLSNVHVYCHFKYRVPYNVQTWTRFGTGTD